MFSRTAIRLAVIEALSPAALATTGPWPTIAGPRVYDSRMDPIDTDEDMARIEGKPILIVYTEEQESRPYGQAKAPPDEQVVDLVVEALIAARGSVVIPLPDGTEEIVGSVGAPFTDRQHEAHLDLLEATVRRILDVRTLAPSAALLRFVAMELRQVDSWPQRDASRVVRLAARTIKFKFKVKTDVWPALPVSPAPTGFALLPKPLSDVAAGLPAGSSGALLCQSLIAAVPQPLAQTPLAGVAVTSHVDRDPATTDPDATPPDGLSFFAVPSPAPSSP